MAFKTEELLGIGVTTLSGDTTIHGNSTINGTLEVNDNVSFNGVMEVSGEAWLTGSTYIGGTLEVQVVSSFLNGIDAQSNNSGNAIYSHNGSVTIESGTLILGNGSNVQSNNYGSLSGNYAIYDGQLHLENGIVVSDGTYSPSGFTNGTSGTSGENGTSGTSGIGIDGTSGTSGATGNDGTSGTSGENGAGSIQELNRGLGYGNGVFAIPPSGTNNFIFGDESMTGITTAISNITFGPLQYPANQTGDKNIFIGSESISGYYPGQLGNRTANNNIAIGHGAMKYAAYDGSPTQNIVVGNDAAGGANMTGDHNILIGHIASQNIKEGSIQNICIGYSVLGGNQQNSQRNIIIGHGAASGGGNNTQSDNLVIGAYAGYNKFSDVTLNKQFLIDGYGAIRNNTAEENENAMFVGQFDRYVQNQSLTINAGVNINGSFTVSGQTISGVSPYGIINVTDPIFTGTTLLKLYRLSGTTDFILPNATGSGNWIKIKNIYSNSITISTLGTQTIDSVSTKILNAFDALEFVDGAVGNWDVI